MVSSCAPHISHPAATCRKTQIKQERKHDNPIEILEEIVDVSSLFLSCVCVCVPHTSCSVYLFFRYSDITRGISTMWSLTKNLHTLAPSCSVWKDVTEIKIPPFRTAAHSEGKCWLTGATAKMSLHRRTSVIRDFDFTPTCSVCTEQLGGKRCDMFCLMFSKWKQHFPYSGVVTIVKRKGRTSKSPYEFRSGKQGDVNLKNAAEILSECWGNTTFTSFLFLWIRAALVSFLRINEDNSWKSVKLIHPI